MSNYELEDWIINNNNIFGLTTDIGLSLSTIQFEILNQLEGKELNSITDFLKIEIDITKEISVNRALTIQKNFTEFLGFDAFNVLVNLTTQCYLIISYLQLSLLKEYYNEKHKNILIFLKYETQYGTLLNNFLNSNIDTDEKDFIVKELIICDNLFIELKKPIYSVITIQNEISNEPCEFKTNLINSIDKRQKYLKEKAIEKLPKEKTVQSQQIKINPYPLLFTSYEVYECFVKYKIHIIDVVTDYSYLKKRLEKLKLIHKHTDKEFMIFLRDEIKFITQKDHENFEYTSESSLKSLSKSYSTQRENNFNIIFRNLLD